MSETAGTKLTSSPEGAALREKLFVERWLTNGNNGAEAAIYAGFSAKNANVKGSQILARPSVQALIGKRNERILRTAELSTERWASEMASIAHLDPGDLYDEDGNLIPIHKLPPHVRRAISAVKHTQRTSGKGEDRETVQETEIKMWDKNTALTNVGRHLGVFEEDNRQNKQPIQIQIIAVGGPHGPAQK